MKRVLVVDDEEDVRATVRQTLGKYEFDVECASNADEAREKVLTFEPDLIVLDIMLPGTSGKDFFRELRQTRSTPVIFLSGLDGDVDRVVGLELGADDYLTKPYHPAELLARVRAVLRRTANDGPHDSDDPPHGSNGVTKKMAYGPIRINLERYEVSVGEQLVELTKTELQLLKTLMRRPGRVYSRDELREGAYGPGFHVTDKTINSHIKRVRNKLEEAGVEPIETVRGVGYRLGALEG
jgi:two-component system OmpR family response regulator